jgi:hypothetical protein
MKIELKLITFKKKKKLLLSTPVKKINIYI